MLFISNTVDIQPQRAPRNERLTILCGCRIVYRPDKHPALGAIDFKGTDILIKGFAQYIRSGEQGILRLPRKGQDLDAAITLISDLGIEKHIDWLDAMPLARFYQEMSAADLVCDQFGTSFPGMVTTDAFALGRPVMAKMRNEIFGKLFPEPLPGFDAVSPEQICEHLMAIRKDSDLLETVGQKSRNYAEKYLSPEAMAKNLLTTWR
ncbi:hypothetical protein C3Y92_20090 (plasmid) [Solidesulfovibrio carbinolicus]|uniref:Glycosyl transferase family 1 domain-containing protein n=2 Tax=Solidesulfovibrio carbinolicus TaxID=296842 RepID=A0A4P6HVN2_9BACT|nr:hypothetical protein C3Y92_20090 [Solidesulfovibrio carbinolicus]